MKEQKNNKVLIILLSIIAIILFILCLLFAIGTINFKTNGDDNKSTLSDMYNNNPEINQILEKLDGVWGFNYYMISINNESKQYLQGQYGTDGFIAGTIVYAKVLSDNKYELEVFVKGCTGSDCMEEREDETKFMVIEYDSSKNVILNNDNEYQLITKDHLDNDTINTFFN